MRIPPYWKRATYTGPVPGGKSYTFTAWGWSFDSPDEAQDSAEARARRIYEHFTNQQPLDEYPYLDRPMREEIVETFTLGNKEVAVLTRNRYGALVLNSPSVMFADVDFPKGKSSSGGGGLFGMFSKPAPAANDPAASTIQRVNEWAQQNPQHAFRLYRTAAGLRLLFTDDLYDATDNQTDAMLESLGSDPLYRTLTQKQESFRARLTPKPWRAKCSNPPNRYPWESSSDEQAYRAWENNYAACTRDYKTAELIQVVGPESGDEEIQQIIQIHDQYALSGGVRLA